MTRRNRRQHHFGPIIVFLLILATLFYVTNRQFDFDSLVKNSELGNKSFSLPVTQVVSPRYKIKAYLLQDTSNPIISLNFLFAHAGEVANKNEQNGLARLSAALISEAAGNMDSQQFKEKLEDYAIAIGYSADNDDFSGSMLTIKEYAPTAFSFLKQTLLEPRIDEVDLNRVKTQMLTTIERQNENPGQQLSLLATKDIFGTHAYGRNPLGDKNVIAKATADDIKQFVTQNLGRSNLVIGIAGDISVEETEKMLDDVFGSLPEQGAVDSTVEADSDFSRKPIFHNENLPQSMAFIAASGTKRKSSDFYPLYIANHILGGSGLSSRLNQAAREKEGLTYGIYTGLSLPDKAALIQGGFSATPENFPRVSEIFAEQWQKIGKEGVSKSELEEAKDYLIASYNLRFADINAISNILVYMQKDDLGIDFLQKRNGYIEKVTLRQINRAAAKYFTPDNLLMINLGKFN